MAHILIEDYHGAIKMEFPPMQSNSMSWFVPLPGVFKINVDGACSLDSGVCSGVGVVIRDGTGTVIAALSKLLPANFPAEWMELYAIEQGLLLAQEMELPQVMMEPDALATILAINQGNSRGEASHLVEGILRAEAFFSSCSFCPLEKGLQQGCTQACSVRQGQSLYSSLERCYHTFCISFGCIKFRASLCVSC